MNGHGHAAHDPGTAPQPLPSRIVITFPGPGLSGCDVSAVGIVPAQMYEAAWLLDAMARETRTGQLMGQAQAQAGGTSTPGDDLVTQMLYAIRRMSGT